MITRAAADKNTVFYSGPPVKIRAKGMTAVPVEVSGPSQLGCAWSIRRRTVMSFSNRKDIIQCHQYKR